MHRRSLRNWSLTWVAALIVSLAIGAAGCGSDSTDASNVAGDPTDTDSATEPAPVPGPAPRPEPEPEPNPEPDPSPALPSIPAGETVTALSCRHFELIPFRGNFTGMRERELVVRDGAIVIALGDNEYPVGTLADATDMDAEGWTVISTAPVTAFRTRVNADGTVAWHRQSGRYDADECAVGLQAPTLFPINEFKGRLINQGATWTMSGTFNNGGQTETHSQQFNLAPADIGINWEGMSGLRRSQLVVARTVNGVPGTGESQATYFDADNIWMGRDHITNSETAIGNNDGPNRETIEYASVRAYGVVRNANIYPSGNTSDPIDTSESIAGEFITWRVVGLDGQRFPDDPPSDIESHARYCEQSRVNRPAPAINWDYEWCYGIDGSGHPTGYVSYEYSTDHGNSGRLQGNDFVLGGRPVDSEN